MTFAACAHAVRKRSFEQIGGYAEDYFYMGEEGDLAIRLLDRGHLVEIGTSDPIHHMQPPRRRAYRPDFYGRRNDLLFYYLRCPARYLPARYVGAIVKGMLFGARNQCIKATLDGLARRASGRRSAGRARRSPVARRRRSGCSLPASIAEACRQRRSRRCSPPDRLPPVSVIAAIAASPRSDHRGEILDGLGPGPPAAGPTAASPVGLARG